MVRFGVLVTRAKGEEMLRNRGGQTRGIKEGSVGENSILDTLDAWTMCRGGSGRPAGEVKSPSRGSVSKTINLYFEFDNNFLPFQ